MYREQALNDTRNTIKEAAKQLTSGQAGKFKRIFGGEIQDKPIDEVIDNMPEENFKTALFLLDRTLDLDFRP
jgi:CHAT domain-containing protein